MVAYFVELYRLSSCKVLNTPFGTEDRISGYPLPITEKDDFRHWQKDDKNNFTYQFATQNAT